MKNKLFGLILIFSLLTGACARDESAVTESPAITSTPDLCSSTNLPDQVARVNRLMREFDDYAELASNTPQAQLVVLIPEMQRILREAEDQSVPACLQTLKDLQLAHMNVVIQTLMAFMSSADLNAVNQGIAAARDSHNQYDIEMARLLGVTLVPQPTNTPSP
ncbi:MAG: hypothetical protein FJZ87_05650 [Chloroflexi bacterium]|nr:hypothetical protein [Chloroflexota bacterium]